MKVILIAVDTLRADHLGCYGYSRRTSPNLDSLANESVLFSNCISDCSHTVPAFTSMFTGLSPISHGVVGTLWNLPNENSDLLDDSVPVLAELLEREGYTTAAVDDLFSFAFHPKWFVRGYRYYMNPSPLRGDKVRADQVNGMAIPWLRNYSGKEFFLFLHYWDPHQRYSPPPPFDKCFQKDEGLKVKELATGEKFVISAGKTAYLDEKILQRVNFHDGEISYVDDRIGKLLSTLKELGIYDDSLIVVTSDHGDDMAEHNCNFEHRELYDSTIHVPLIYKLPKELQKRECKKVIDGLVQHSDLTPTILDMMGVKNPPKMDGHSLKPLILAEAEQVRQEAFSTGSWIYHAGRWKSAEICIRTKRWKLYKRADITKAFPCPKPIFGFYGRHIVGDPRDPTEIFLSLPKRELYDLTVDPEEQVNIAERRGDIAEELERKLEKWTNSGLFVS